jgi:hypothetical protein|nr:MAG TPA: hypothetical protein [Caudoviricetes sp.]
MWKLALGFITSSKGIALAIALFFGLYTGALASQAIQIHSLNKEVKSLNEDIAQTIVKKELIKYEIERCREIVNQQNSAIEKSKVDLSNLEKEKDKIVRKFNKIKLPDPSSCISKLEYYENLFRGLSSERTENENRSLQNATSKK